MEFLTLDIGGIVLAVILGIILLSLGLGLGYFFLIAMIAFLVLSAIVTWTGIKRKKRLGIGQGSRGIRNVLANGMPAVIMSIIFYLAESNGNVLIALSAVIGLLGSIAAITADKFNSEIGVLGGVPHMIFTMKKVRRGTSGGITAFGTMAGLVGAVIIASLILPAAGKIRAVLGIGHFGIAAALVIIAVSGFVGSVIDSAFGYYEERGIGNKFTSNFACGISAGIIAFAVSMLLFAAI